MGDNGMNGGGGVTKYLVGTVKKMYPALGTGHWALSPIRLPGHVPVVLELT